MRFSHKQVGIQQQLLQIGKEAYANSSLCAQKSHSLDGTYKTSGPWSSDSSEDVNEKGKGSS